MRAWKSTFYVLSAQLVNMIMIFGSMLILARMLEPYQFGLYTIVMAVSSLIMPYSNAGLDTAIIKADHVSEKKLNIFFTFGIGVAVILSLVTALLSGAISEFYGKNELVLGLYLVSSLVFLNALIDQFRSYLSLHKKFDLVAYGSVFLNLFKSVLSVVFVYFYPTYTSILMGNVIALVLLFVFYIWVIEHKYRIVSLVDYRECLSDVKYGFDVVMSRGVGAFANVFDKILIGKYFPINDVGGYGRAQQLAMLPDANIRNPLTSTVLVYLHNSTKEYLSLYSIVSWFFLVVAGGISIFFVVMGDLIMPLLLGDQWLDVGVMLQVLGIWSIGKVYYGVSLVHHLNNRKTRRWMRMIFLYIAIGVMMMIGLLSQEVELLNLIVLMSILYMAFWFIGSFWLLSLDYLKKKRELVVMFLRQFSYIISLSLVAFWLKLYLIGCMSCSMENIESAFSVLFIFVPSYALFIFILTILFAKTEVSEIICMILDKRKNNES